MPAIDPRTPTSGFENSPNYRKLEKGEEPRRGDVVVQGSGPPSGHAGIVTGQKDGKGRLTAYSNGSHGNKVIPFGKGVGGLANVDPVFYRRQVPRT
ncbi:MAG: CHAP domain-containing protein [Gemmatimonadetes bacterium]|nr:CHAP domain-containing protein [Gemmatimonadota bacterium]